MTVLVDITESPVYALGYPDPDRQMDPDGIASGGAFGTAQLNAEVVASGVASAVAFGTAATATPISPTGFVDAGALGQPQLDATVVASGVASAVDFGTTQLDATVVAAGFASPGTVGAAYAFHVLSPAGFDASGGGSGTPATTASMHAAGIASTAAFGDHETLATVFIIPGPVDPSNDFGDAVVTKKGWVFRPPVNTYQWRLFKEYEGISLLKENGTWSEVAHPDLERTRAAQKYLAGGRDHVVGDSLKAELIAEGYTVTEEIVTTEEYL